jgi:hypothetical protein
MEGVLTGFASIEKANDETTTESKAAVLPVDVRLPPETFGFATASRLCLFDSHFRLLVDHVADWVSGPLT